MLYECVLFCVAISGVRPGLGTRRADNRLEKQEERNPLAYRRPEACRAASGTGYVCDAERTLEPACGSEIGCSKTRGHEVCSLWCRICSELNCDRMGGISCEMMSYYFHESLSRRLLLFISPAPLKAPETRWPLTVKLSVTCLSLFNVDDIL